MTPRDPIEVLVSHQANVLVRCGRPMEAARVEAEDIVASLLGDLARLGCAGVPIDQLFRRARVYRLRCQGNTVQIISERMGVSIATVKRDIVCELRRRRSAV